MTRRDLYVRPANLMHGVEAKARVADRNAGWLAGGPVAFGEVQLIGPQGSMKSSIPFRDFKKSKETALLSDLEMLEAQRAPISGLTLDRPLVMGIVNVTPDSFSDGGEFDDEKTAIAHGRRLAAEGAAILDVGGESTRPGSDAVSVGRELERVLPVLRGLSDTGCLLSCDTRKSGVMRAAQGAGAGLINDVSALNYDPDALAFIAESELPVVLMHAQGAPKTMQEDPYYDNVCLDVFDALAARIEVCIAAGIAREKIIADPGIGFGKTFGHNLQLIAHLALFHGLGVPLMLGASRKAFIGAITDTKDAGGRVYGSVAIALEGARRGVQILRVHDVAPTVQALAVQSAVSYEKV